MKKLLFVIFALIIGAMACDNNSNQASQEATVADPDIAEDASVKTLVNEAYSETTTTNTDQTLITPEDISEEAQATMYQTIFDYNQCMQTGRLAATQQGKPMEQLANEIMDSCEPYMDSLKVHLLANNVNEPLVIGMTKKMRSRAARKLMTQGMNQMAAQAAAVEKAEQMKAAGSK